MNEEERNVFAQYAVRRIQNILQEKEDLENLVNVLGKPILEAEKPVTTVTGDKKPTEVQFNAPNWVTKEGSKGNYQQVENDKTETFRIIQQYVKSKGSFANIYGFKTWFHNNNENIVDRKR